MAPFTPYVWVLPTFVLICLFALSAVNGVLVPAPFLMLVYSVVVAGAYGGVLPGVLAGLAASLFLIFANRMGYAPSLLTDGPTQMLLGTGLFLFLGGTIGQFKARYDHRIRILSDKEANLRASLEKEVAEKVDQDARIASNEEQLRRAVRISGIGHFRWILETGNCDYCSDQHAAHFGLTAEAFVAKTKGRAPYMDFIHPDDHQSVLDAITQIDRGEAMFFEYRAMRPDGEIRFLRQINEPVFDETGVQIEVVGSSIDLTDLREAEARVRQSQRIEAIGTLTGGVAHDFNNLLAVILGNLELVQDESRPQEQHALIQEAIKATYRGADLTKNLLSFARRAHLTPTRLNMNHVVQTTMEWGFRVMPANISIESSLMAGLWDTDLDATSVENAIINILLNARDAMPEGGKVTIETANMRIGEEYLQERQEDVEPGRYVMLAISDTGHGIVADKLRMIFEPFYTEKPPGSGSGLGLSMVQGFIKQSGGAVRVYSEVGTGTTFKLYFKAATQSPDKQVPQVQRAVAPPANGARVLLAEDEMAVSRVLKSVLENAGYGVTSAANGDEALAIFEASGPFDILLTDVVMPGTLQGPALAKAIRAVSPDIPCIFLSGYAAEATVHGNGLKPSDIRLMKPIGRQDLLNAIAKALQGRETAG